VVGHYEAMLAFYGVDLGLKVARKHLGWYLDEAGLQGHRAAVMAAATPAATIEVLRRAFDVGQQVAA
jgi:tRNA-dihydrouridine synthase B